MQFLQARAESKDQTLNIDCPETGLLPVQADPLALESIFGNLITNAINYTQEGGEIRVKVEKRGINLSVQVIDNGFGIETRYLDKIFDRFFRVKNERYFSPQQTCF